MKLKSAQGSWVETLPLNRWELACLLAGAATLVYLFTLPSVTSRLVDLPVYYLAGQKAIAHQSVYDIDGHFQFKYSPLVAWLFGKLSAGQDLAHVASIVHRVSLLGILGLFVFWAKKLLQEHGLKRFSSPIALALLSFAFLAAPLKHEIQLGQVNLAPIALTTLFVWTGRKGAVGTLASALALSVAIQLKLFCVVFLFIPFLRREWIFFPVFLGVFFVSLYFPMTWIHGSEFASGEIQAWLATLGNSTGTLLAHEENVSILGALSKIFGSDSPWARSIWCLAGAIFAADWIRREWDQARPFHSLCNSMSVILLFNPLVWSYWVWFLAPLLMLLLDRFSFPRTTLSRVSVVAGIGLLWLSFNAQSAGVNRNWGLLPAIVFLCTLARRESRKLEPA